MPLVEGKPRRHGPHVLCPVARGREKERGDTEIEALAPVAYMCRPSHPWPMRGDPNFFGGELVMAEVKLRICRLKEHNFRSNRI